MLDLNKLHIFMTVARVGSFSGAARQLYITQSAVSQHIKDLERRFGRALFERSYQGVNLTAHGQILFERAGIVLEQIAQIDHALTDVGQIEAGKVTIGATSGIAAYLAPEWVARFRVLYPNLTVALQTGTTPEVINTVLSGRAEIGFIEGEPDPALGNCLGCVKLHDVPQVIVVGNQHQWWETPQRTLNDLSGQSFIMRPPDSQSRRWLDDTLHNHQIDYQIGAEFDSVESIKRAVAGGSCLAIVPAYTVASEIAQGTLREVPLLDTQLVRTLRLVWNPDLYLSPVVRAFLKMLSERYHELAIPAIIDDPL